MKTRLCQPGNYLWSHTYAELADNSLIESRGTQFGGQFGSIENLFPRSHSQAH